ncbi:hypothetical protein ES706_06369 [subsurface metagenome]
MAELLTAKELAEKAGISPTELRKLLRKEFNRAGKTKVEGNRLEYRFDSSDLVVKQIIDRAKGKPAEKPKAEKTAKPKQSPGEKTVEKLAKKAANKAQAKPPAYAVYDEMTGEVEVIGGQEPKGETGES